MVHWAHGVRERFPDGELYVNLRGFDPAADPMPVADALASLLAGLGIAPEQQSAEVEARAALLRSAAHGKRLLVLLDNAATTAQVRPLLPGSPSCLVVVTSRNRLEDLVIREGATRMTLDVLTSTEARELLGRHLGAKRLGAEPEAAEALVGHCAGLPLALGIVAYRAAENPDFPLDVLVAELRDEKERLDALDLGGETGVRSVFSWSYRRLSDEAASMFRLLGLPTGPDISLAAAADLAGLPRRRARTALAELTRAHLVEQHQPGRYRFHDLLRAYAAECAADDETPETRQAALRRLLDHYLRTSSGAALRFVQHSEHLRPELPTSKISGQTFNEDQAALRWWDSEITNLTSAIHQASREGLHEHAWQLSHSLAYHFQLRGNTTDRLAMCEIALDSVRQLENRQAEAHLLNQMAIVHFNRQHFELSAELSEQARMILGELGDRQREAPILIGLGHDYVHLKKYDTARERLERGMKIMTDLGDVNGQGYAHGGLGLLHSEQHAFDSAVEHLQQALTCYRKIDEKFGEGFVLNDLANTYRRAGETDKALETYRLAVAHRQKIQHRQGEATSLRGLGEMLQETGDRDGARTCWEQALKTLEELGHPEAGEVKALLEE